MRLFIVLAVALILTGGCTRPEAGPGTAPEATRPHSGPQAHSRLEGTWRVLSISSNGRPVPADRVADLHVVFAGQQYSLRKGRQELELATWVTSTEGQLQTIDLTFSKGLAAGNTLQGIYELADNRLRIAFAAPGQRRPAAISAQEGQQQDVWQLQRQ